MTCVCSERAGDYTRIVHPGRDYTPPAVSQAWIRPESEAASEDNTRQHRSAGGGYSCSDAASSNCDDVGVFLLYASLMMTE